ncbi:MAG: acyl-CoA dehydrogenase family protein [Eggerthellaceae bacterium]|jgi:alkylation response protein AidB-like acyl-CoA dehydrogenase
MSYLFNDDQKMVQKIAREFAETEVRPRAAEIDKSNAFPRDLYKKAAELGFTGLLVPQEFGGTGAGMSATAAVIEEIAKESPAFALSLYVTVAIPTYLFDAPNAKELCAEYLPGLLSGDILFSAPITFPVGCTNFAEWPTFAKRDGDEWVLNGTKLYATNTGAADVAIVVGPADDGQIYAFVVDTDNPGMEDSHVEDKIGVNGNCSGTNVFSDCRVKADHAFPKKLGEGIGAGNAFCAAAALGCAEGAWQKTLEFTKVRTRNNTPIVNLQAVAHRLARMSGEIEKCRALIYEALLLGDLALLHKDNSNDAEIKRLVNTAKYSTCEMAIDVAKQCIWMHGGLGVVKETGVERYLRDAACLAVADGTPDQHVETVAALLGLPGSQVMY